jgi:N utilization substance protein B
VKSRRKAREGALRVLYEMEVGGASLDDAMASMMDEADVTEELMPYSERLIRGVREHRIKIDKELAGYVREYDYSRLAAIDRNILRIGAYELLHVPEIPPAVTINEAIEIAKKFSTAESGKFVNGVLARMLKDSEKANWNPATAPAEFAEEIVQEPAKVIEEETVEADSEEGMKARKFGQWTIRKDEEPT